MGLKGEFKKWLFTIFGARCVTTPVIGADGVLTQRETIMCAIKDHLDKSELPDVVIFDHTKTLKYCRRGLKTGKDFFVEQFLRQTIKPINETKTRVVYICLDRGSPVCKSIEHKKRRKNVSISKRIDMDALDVSKIPRMTDKTSTPSDDVTWKACTRDPMYLSHLVHYLTVKFVGIEGIEDERLKKIIRHVVFSSNDDNGDKDGIENDGTFDPNDKTCEYSPPPCKRICLYGGRITRPVRPEVIGSSVLRHLLDDKLIVIDGVDTSFVPLSKDSIEKKIPDHVFAFDDADNDNDDDDDNGGTKMSSHSTTTKTTIHVDDGKKRFPTFKSKRRVTFDDSPDRIPLSNLLEGEIQAMHFAYKHTLAGESVMIVTPDGDVLMMALMSSLHRINPVTGKFINTMYVCLEIPGGPNGGVASKQYVNVNELWWNIYSSRSSHPRDEARTFPMFYKGLNNIGFQFVTQLCFVGMSCGGTDYVEHCTTEVVNNSAGFDASAYKDGAFSTTFLKSKHVPYTSQNITMPKLTTAASKKKAAMMMTTSSSSSSSLSQKMEQRMVTKCDILRETTIPWPMHSFLKYYHDESKRFFNIVNIKPVKVVYNEQATLVPFGLTHIPFAHACDILVDEEAFIFLVRMTYIDKAKTIKKFNDAYGKIISNDDMQKTFECVRRYFYYDRMEECRKRYDNNVKKTIHSNATPWLGDLTSIETPSSSLSMMLKSKKPKSIDYDAEMKSIKSKRIPTKRRIRVNARRCEWQTGYYVNSFKELCVFPDPTLVYDELPFYGWYTTPSGKCNIARRVSKHPSKIIIQTK